MALTHEVDHSPQGGVSSALDGSAAVCVRGGQPVEFPDAVFSPSNGVSWTGSRAQLRLREKLGIEHLPQDWACAGAGSQLSCQVEFQFPRRDEASQKRAALALRSGGGLEAAKAELTTKVIRRIEFTRATRAEFAGRCRQAR